MSEYQTHRCGHCNGPKKKLGEKVKPNYKKINEEKLYTLVKTYILKLKKNDKKFIFAEEIAKKFQVKKHRITKIFMKLNQQGIISQAHNKPPHDCRRSTTFMDYGKDNSWRASIYYINDE